MDSGVATRPIADMDAYRERLQGFVFRSGLLMKPVFDAAARGPRRVVYAEGEDERVLHCAQQALSLGIAEPILIGDTRADRRARSKTLGLTHRPGPMSRSSIPAASTPRPMPPTCTPRRPQRRRAQGGAARRARRPDRARPA